MKRKPKKVMRHIKERKRYLKILKQSKKMKKETEI